jgi:hypothetical protein
MAPRRCRLHHLIGAGLLASFLSTALLLFHANSIAPSASSAAKVRVASALQRIGRAFAPALRATNSSGSAALQTFRRAINATTSLMKFACRDDDSQCELWASSGECERNPVFMNTSCKRSCGQCRGDLQDLGAAAAKRRSCTDHSSFCGQWAAVGECDSSASRPPLSGCRRLGCRSAAASAADAAAVPAAAAAAAAAVDGRAWFARVLCLRVSDPNYMRANCPVTCHLCQSDACHDEDTAACASEAAAGKCSTDPESMFARCRWTCKWCAMETGSRCKRQADDVPAARQGTLDYMFRRAASERSLAQFRPVVHSRDPWIVRPRLSLSLGPPA